MDYFDLTRKFKTISDVFSKGNFRTLLIGYSTDWRYPPDEMREVSQALTAGNKPNDFRILDSNFGHGAFIYDSHGVLDEIRKFMSSSE